MFAQLQESTDFIQQQTSIFRPVLGIILGTGLGKLADAIQQEHVLPYSAIPGFSTSTVEGHSGKLIFGYLGRKAVVAMQGRFHYYEGYSMQQVTFPVRVMKALGIKHLFVSNASGGLNPQFSTGDLMIITDHIHFFPANPLRGEHRDTSLPRFVDMSEPYDATLIEKAKSIAERHGIPLRTGTYIGVQGPSLETPAEYRCFRVLGADAVGMSTVPEIIVARQLGLPCFALSVITNMGTGEKISKTSHDDVQQRAAGAEPRMTLLVEELAKSL